MIHHHHVERNVFDQPRKAGFSRRLVLAQLSNH
jgi:hypothetical protein